MRENCTVQYIFFSRKVRNRIGVKICLQPEIYRTNYLRLLLLLLFMYCLFHQCLTVFNFPVITFWFRHTLNVYTSAICFLSCLWCHWGVLWIMHRYRWTCKYDIWCFYHQSISILLLMLYFCISQCVYCSLCCVFLSWSKFLFSLEYSFWNRYSKWNCLGYDDMCCLHWKYTP